jgi:hypothetical protein
VTDLLIDYERKRRRAKRHADVLRKLLERSANVDSQPIKGKLQLDSGKHEFKVPLERIDPDVAVVVGDFIYNTRASLDYLVTALVRSTGHEEHTRSQFPIYTPDGLPRGVRLEDVHDWWDHSAEVERDLQNTQPGTKAALKPLQPFYGIPRTDWLGHPLGVLAALSNRDKHRRLNLLAHRASIQFIDADGQPLFQHGAPFYTVIPEGGEGETYTVLLGLPPNKAHMDVYLLASHEIRLDEPPQVIGELVETLTRIDEFIDGRVLPAVKSLL